MLHWSEQVRQTQKARKRKEAGKIPLRKAPASCGTYSKEGEGQAAGRKDEKSNIED